MPEWENLPWAESWAFGHNAIQFCVLHFGKAETTCGVVRVNAIITLPTALWFSNSEDALIFKLAFKNCTEYL